MPDTTKNSNDNPNSRAVLPFKIELHSLQAQKVINRSFERLKRSLFSTSVILRIITKDEKAISTVEDYINNQFEDVDKELSSKIAQINKVLEDNGIEKKVSYTDPVKFDLEIDSPKARQYLGLVLKLDEVMALIDTAWMCGELKDDQKNRACFSLQQRLINLAGRIIKLENDVRASARSTGKDNEVKKQAPEDKTEIDAEIAKAAQDANAELPALDVAS